MATGLVVTVVTRAGGRLGRARAASVSPGWLGTGHCAALAVI
jgi:hypothetical protein